MIISMTMEVTENDLKSVTNLVVGSGYKARLVDGQKSITIAVVGGKGPTAWLDSVRALPQVESVVNISARRDWIWRVHHNCRPVFTRKRKTNYGHRCLRRQSRGPLPKSWNIQATHLTLRLSGDGP